MLPRSIEDFLKALPADPPTAPLVVTVGRLPDCFWRVYVGHTSIALVTFVDGVVRLETGELPPGIRLADVRAAILEAL